jgi:hypothetical protein
MPDKNGVPTNAGLLAFANVLYHTDLTEWDPEKQPLSYLMVRNKISHLQGVKKWWYEGLISGRFEVVQDNRYSQEFNTDGDTEFDVEMLLKSYNDGPYCTRKADITELTNVFIDIFDRIDKSSKKVTRYMVSKRGADEGFTKEVVTMHFKFGSLFDCRDAMEAFMPGARQGWETQMEPGENTQPYVGTCYAQDRRRRLREATDREVASCYYLAASALGYMMAPPEKSSLPLSYEEINPGMIDQYMRPENYQKMLQDVREYKRNRKDPRAEEGVAPE